MIKKPRVLIIDDDSWMAAQYARGLEEAGFAVLTAANAMEGIEEIDRLHPNVVLLDLLMPGPNGIVLLHELQSHTDLAQIPVVVCSNSASALTLEDLRAYGVVGLLDKGTVTPDDIVAAVRKAMM